MKSKITFFTVLFISLFSNAQSPINAYFDYTSTGNVYSILDVATPLDQTTAGANLTWNFDQFTSIGTSIGTNAVPTTTEVATFPNSTTVSIVESTTTGTPSTNKIYSKTIANAVSLTGFVSTDVNLNFVTNNALLGTFPLNYGYNFTDTTAGTWVSGTYTGTFTGTMTTSVDAYGTLNINDTGNGAYSGAVTRLKTVQNINLIYPFFGNVGTVVMTTYGYVDASNTAQFRFSEIIANIPLLNVVNQTATTMEDFNFLQLANRQNDFAANGVALYPNPVVDFLNIKSFDIASEITITDINGREVIRQNNNLDKIAITNLQKGVYFANVTTDKGTFTQKFVKE
jgi:Secretion system C-terminal sorting domain